MNKYLILVLALFFYEKSNLIFSQGISSPCEKSLDKDSEDSLFECINEKKFDLIELEKNARVNPKFINFAFRLFSRQRKEHTHNENFQFLKNKIRIMSEFDKSLHESNLPFSFEELLGLCEKNVSIFINTTYFSEIYIANIGAPTLKNIKENLYNNLTSEDILQIQKNQYDFDHLECTKRLYRDMTISEMSEHHVRSIPANVCSQIKKLNLTKEQFLNLFKDGVRLDDSYILESLRMPFNKFLKKFYFTPIIIKPFDGDDLTLQVQAKKKIFNWIVPIYRKRMLKKYNFSNTERDNAQQLEEIGKINEAIWAYERAGEEEDLLRAKNLSLILEEIMEKGILNFEDAIDLSGVTSPKKVTISHTINNKIYNISVIVKKNINGAHTSLEKFASYLNDFLGLHLVPKTILRTIDGEKYSLQYFIKDTVNPTYSNYNPSSSTLPNGHMRGAFLDDLHVFDFLTNNTDRHDRNYLLGNPKEPNLKIGGIFQPVYAIDHGDLFGAGKYDELIIKNLHDLKPSLRFFIALDRMESKITDFQKEVLENNMLSKFNLTIFLNKRQELINHMHKRLENETMDQIWPGIYSRNIGRRPIL